MLIYYLLYINLGIYVEVMKIVFCYSYAKKPLLKPLKSLITKQNARQREDFNYYYLDCYMNYDKPLKLLPDSSIVKV